MNVSVRGECQCVEIVSVWGGCQIQLQKSDFDWIYLQQYIVWGDTPLSSEAKLLASEASVNITTHRGSPPHLNNSDLDNPQDREESVAMTTLGPG